MVNTRYIWFWCIYLTCTIDRKLKGSPLFTLEYIRTSDSQNYYNQKWKTAILNRKCNSFLLNVFSKPQGLNNCQLSPSFFLYRPILLVVAADKYEQTNRGSLCVLHTTCVVNVWFKIVAHWGHDFTVGLLITKLNNPRIQLWNHGLVAQHFKI